jgi:hypothetical protein
MEPVTFTKEQAIAGYWEIATITPEDSNGDLRAQIRACRNLYRFHGYEPALQRLSEIANIDPAKTKGRRRGQEAAAKMLKGFVSSIKPDKSGVQ